MENIQSSSLKTKPEVISDLKQLLVLVNDGKEGYQLAAEATESPELKTLFLKLSGERIVYASELTEHIAAHGGHAENEEGGLLGGLHRAWLTVKQAFSGKEDKSILQAITTGEKAAIEKYDQCIADYADHADHLELLKEQREGIQEALKEVEQRIVQLN
jgi:uncharacterized protein (TIGR02284 family)